MAFQIPNENDILIVTLKSNTGNEVALKIRRGVVMWQVMVKYCEIYNIPIHTISFWFGSTPILTSDSAFSLNIQNHDVIYVFHWQM